MQDRVTCKLHSLCGAVRHGCISRQRLHIPVKSGPIKWNDDDFAAVIVIRQFLFLGHVEHGET